MVGTPEDIQTDYGRGYGWAYDFNQFYNQETNGFQDHGYGVILPSFEPAVFELKYPNENIKGTVR